METLFRFRCNSIIQYYYSNTIPAILLIKFTFTPQIDTSINGPSCWITPRLFSAPVGVGPMIRWLYPCNGWKLSIGERGERNLRNACARWPYKETPGSQSSRELITFDRMQKRQNYSINPLQVIDRSLQNCSSSRGSDQPHTPRLIPRKGHI